MIFQYHKLVRDKIPQTIESKGNKCRYSILGEEEYQKELDKKLLEEANEFLADHSIEEMADLLEVVETLQKAYHLEKEEIERVRLEKRAKKGGFEDKVYLIDVEEKEKNDTEQ